MYSVHNKLDLCFNARWCLNLKMLSSSAYHCLRSSGFIKLPSERSLRDYTHFFKSKEGFQREVDEMLQNEAQIHTAERKKYVALLFDEMKVKESLVYDKYSAEVIGFVDLDMIDDQLDELAKHPNKQQIPPIATHILAIMVRGIFTGLKFPYAHFATTSVKGDQLFTIAWEAIDRLERSGFKVIAITADGASSNRKFFRMHSGKSDSN